MTICSLSPRRSCLKAKHWRTSHRGATPLSSRSFFSTNSKPMTITQLVCSAGSAQTVLFRVPLLWTKSRALPMEEMTSEVSNRWQHLCHFSHSSHFHSSDESWQALLFVDCPRHIAHKGRLPRTLQRLAPLFIKPIQITSNQQIEQNSKQWFKMCFHSRQSIHGWYRWQ